MSYPPPGGTPDPQHPYGHQSNDPTAPYQQDPYGAPASGAPASGQPYGAPGSGPPSYGQPPVSDPYAQPYGAQPYGAGPGYPAATGTNVMAILALVFAFIFPPAAIVLGHVAKKQMKQTGEQGAGLATAGLWLGYIFTGLTLAMCVLWGILVAVGIGSSSGSTSY